MSIKDISLGEDIKLQIIALTEHPVGGVDQSKSANSEGRYAECTPGPKLNLQVIFQKCKHLNSLCLDICQNIPKVLNVCYVLEDIITNVSINNLTKY